MPQWTNRPEKEGYYWYWYEDDWGYENAKGKGRGAKIRYVYGIEGTGDNESIIVRTQFGPYGIIAELNRSFTQEYSISESCWYWGPISEPKPPLPSGTYINRLRKIANRTNFEPDPILRNSYPFERDWKALPYELKRETEKAKKQLEIVMRRIAEYEDD